MKSARFWIAVLVAFFLMWTLAGLWNFVLLGGIGGALFGLILKGEG